LTYDKQVLIIKVVPTSDVGPALSALADPTRRSIYELIVAEPSSVRRLTDRVGISQPGVSQHLRVLRESGLASAAPKGASTIYSADPAGLDLIRNWMDGLWDHALDAFVEAAEQKANR
jgi:DNA-binding transcriptional ArsR family regulator